MQRQKVTVTIDNEGKTEVKVEGIKGMSCKTLTAELERALGGKVISDTPTREMMEVNREQNRVSN